MWKDVQDVDIEQLRSALAEHKQRAADLMIHAENLEVVLLVLQENYESAVRRKALRESIVEKS